ncbi:hypothetical protein [Nocardia salmonicida]|uniref:hypothetical protein n=1 Tax=Nocardia salmonicida TaxID=53431 RepID=UPI0037B83262
MIPMTARGSQAPRMVLPPLPIRTRIHHGEELDSYRLRLATSNYSTPSAIETTLRLGGLLVSKSRGDPRLLQLWRELGALHPSTLTVTPALSTVTSRPLCRRCTRGADAIGRIPDTGWICRRHRRWLGGPQLDVHTYPAAVAAETAFRTHLRPRGIVHDGFAMEFARECTAPGVVCTREMARRRTDTGIDEHEVLIYPERIRLARLITDRQFLGTACDPDIDDRGRRSYIARAVASLFVLGPDDEYWRITNRLCRLTTILSTIRLSPSVYLVGRAIERNHTDLLRFLPAVSSRRYRGDEEFPDTDPNHCATAITADISATTVGVVEPTSLDLWRRDRRWADRANASLCGCGRDGEHCPAPGESKSGADIRSLFRLPRRCTQNRAGTPQRRETSADSND